MGLSRVLVTCDEDNPPSRRVIEKNGGKLANRGTSERTGKPILRPGLFTDAYFAHPDEIVPLIESAGLSTVSPN